MLRGIRCLGLLVMLALIFPASSVSQEKKDDPKKDVKKDDKKTDKDSKDSKDTKDKDKDKKKEEYVAAGVFTGSVIKVENGRVSLMTKQRVFNGKQFEMKDKQVDFDVAEDMFVRIQEPPFAFDDKGRKKVYSKEELDELKGPDKKLWGYNSDLDAVKPGQVIQMFLGKKKGAAKSDPPVIIKIHVAGNGGAG